MEIKVNDQPQRFYLALDYWAPVVGHEIQVGEYKFCAIPMSKEINVSEATSGNKVVSIPLNNEIMSITAHKENTLLFFESIGRVLANKLVTYPNFKEKLEEGRINTIAKLGPMPPIQKVTVGFH